MDAIEFIHERNRMCATYTPKRCEGRPADNYGEMGTACIMIDKIDAERLVPIVEEWSAEHPRKTRQDAFLEQWPNAQMEFGVLQICPRSIMGPNGWRKDGCGGVQCVTCRREFWSQEVE